MRQILDGSVDRGWVDKLLQERGCTDRRDGAR